METDVRCIQDMMKKGLTKPYHVEKWLREKKHIYISVRLMGNVDQQAKYFYILQETKYGTSLMPEEYVSPEYNTYEECVDGAIAYCLDNIDILTSKVEDIWEALFIKE